MDATFHSLECEEKKLSSHVSLLRGINVGGKLVGMEKLRRLYESCGLENVRTYIRSGNVLYDTKARDQSAVVSMLEEKIKKAFGFDVALIVRSASELQNIIRNSPFAKKDTQWLHVTFLREVPVSAPIDEISRFKQGGEEFEIRGREVFLYCPKGYGRSKLSNALFERKLNSVATTRNWNTVKTLAEMLRGS